jgi:hypothetical protein
MLSFFQVPKGVLQWLDYYRSRFFWQGDLEKIYTFSKKRKGETADLVTNRNKSTSRIVMRKADERQ